MTWIGLSLVFLAVGLAFGNLVLLTGAVFLLVVVLIITSLQPPSGIRIERRTLRAICWAGDSVEVERHLTATGGLGPIFVHDALPPELEVDEGNNLRVVWKWLGAKDCDLSYRVRFPKRGEFTLPATTWESQAPLGVRRSRIATSGDSISISVVPRIRGITRLNEIRVITKQTRYQDDLAQTGMSNSEFRELRPYAPGDPIKLINWKASSRGARSDNLPLVNELEPEGRKAVWIFLDTARYMDVGTPLDNPMENTVEAAGSLAQFYLSRGSTIGAYAYNSYGDGGVLLSPDSGQKQFRRLTQMLAGLKSGPPRHDLLQAVEWCKGFLLRLQPEIFIITRLDVYYPRPGEGRQPFDRFNAAVRRLTALRSRARRSGRVRVVHVSPHESNADTTSPFDDIDMSQWESRSLATDLRRSGADVIDWDPGKEDFIAAMVRHMNVYR
jgi:uncharacterized protein (DUF58 family)